jgi:hypothetical protein
MHLPKVNKKNSQEYNQAFPAKRQRHINKLITSAYTETLIITCSMQIRNKKFWDELPTFVSLHIEYLIRHGPHKENTAPNSSIVACVFAAKGTFYRATA